MIALLLLAFLELPEQAAALLERIERLAAAEPPVLGIDTQIRTARALLKKEPAEAQRLLEAAASRAMALPDIPTRGFFLVQIARDAENPERLCALLPPQGLKQPDASQDQCFHNVLGHAKDWTRAKELYRAALFAGAIASPSLVDHLKLAAKSHPEDLEAEFQLWLDAFPDRAATREQRARLDEAASEVLKSAPKLALSARKRADLDAFPKPPEEKKKQKEMDQEGPSTEGLRPDEIVSLARKQSGPVHLGMLLELLDDKKEKALPLESRISMAYEALELSPKLEANEDRLIVQSMLARRLLGYGDRGKAAVGAQMLAETFEKIYDCESGPCSVVRNGDNPGEHIQDFADYLVEYSISMEDLGLSHRSLEARMLLAKLEELLTGQKGGIRFRLFQ